MLILHNCLDHSVLQGPRFPGPPNLKQAPGQAVIQGQWEGMFQISWGTQLSSKMPKRHWGFLPTARRVTLEVGLPATVLTSVTEAPARSLAITSEYTQSQNPPAKPLLNSDAPRSLFDASGRQGLGYFVTQWQMITAHGLDKMWQGCHLFTSAPAGVCLCLQRSGCCIVSMQCHHNPEHPHTAHLAQEPRQCRFRVYSSGRSPKTWHRASRQEVSE